MSDNRQNAKRWCFTINMKDLDDRNREFSCWGLGPADGPQGDWYRFYDDIEYLHFQEEMGERMTHHLQGFVIFKKCVRLSWLKKFHPRAHWEVTRGTNKQADDYTRKDETRFKDGMSLTIGKLPEKVHKKRQEKEEDAEDELENIKTGYKRPAEIDGAILRCPGFIAAYNALVADILGPYRPELKIITLVGPPGTGKSYAIQRYFPEHGRCIYGNSGCWFQNPTAKVMIFEEFNGQIPLTRMLQLLDPYPLSLEVKGRMTPAMYDTVIITSNTSPASWYPIKPQDEAEGGDIFKRKIDAIHALWDRIGYSNGSYIPVRKCGTYIEAPSVSEMLGVSAHDYIQGCREMFHRELLKAANLAEDISDDDVANNADDDH